MSNSTDSPQPGRVVYCNCTYAKVVPDKVKQQVLGKLCASEAPFQAVADLCEMAARKDPALAAIAGSPGTRIVACYPRAVKWLFHGSGTPLPEEGIEILNMREQDADEILSRLALARKEPAVETTG